MITLNYDLLSRQEFISAIRKLANAPIKSVKSILTLMAVVETIDIELKKYQTVMSMILNDLGSPVENEPNSYKIEDSKKEEFNVKVTDLHATTFTVHKDKIHFDDVSTVGLSVAELILLANLIDLSEAHQSDKKPSLSPVS